jgi:hypothetical protein
MKKLLCLLFLLSGIALKSALPGWITITDDDNNRYHVTPHGKIYTSEEPDFYYKPVSKEAMNYYLAQAEILVNKYNKYEGLLLLKSIRYLSEQDPTLYYAGVKSTRLINEMNLDYGDRFKRLDKKASLLLYKHDGHVYVYNENAGTRIDFPGEIEIIKRMTHQTRLYKTDSVKAGIRFSEKEDGKFDALIIMNSEEYVHGRIHDLNKYIEIRSIKKRPSIAVLTQVEREKSKVLFEFQTTSNIPVEEKSPSFTPGENNDETEGASNNFSGLELIFVRKQGGGNIQIVTPQNNFAELRPQLLDLLNTLVLEER